MFCKIIVVLATVCVINASVISDNVFDDEIPENTLSDVEDLVSLKGCNYRVCDQRCRRLKFPGGACVNGRCKCENLLNAEDEMTDPDAVSESNVEDSVPSRACNNNKCNQLCRKKKFRGGACVGANCYCHKFLSLLEDTMNDLEESISLEDNFLITEDAVDEYSEFAPRRICRLTRCNRTCTRRGYDSATCVNGRCKCYNKTQAEDVISGTSLPVSELSEHQTERGCNMQACDQLCRIHKFSGGTCVNGRCKCDNFFGTEDAVDEYSESATRRICNLRQCNRTCTRRGYETARCVNGWCKCYNKILRQDTSPLNDVTSDEIEESNIIVRTTEEELTVPSPRACNTVTCNQMCHRLNYAGGWCRFGQCQCY